MKKSIYRLIAIILVLMMVLGSSPVWAEGSEDDIIIAYGAAEDDFTSVTGESETNVLDLDDVDEEYTEQINVCLSEDTALGNIYPDENYVQDIDTETTNPEEENLEEYAEEIITADYELEESCLEDTAFEEVTGQLEQRYSTSFSVSDEEKKVSVFLNEEDALPLDTTLSVREITINSLNATDQDYYNWIGSILNDYYAEQHIKVVAYSVYDVHLELPKDIVNEDEISNDLFDNTEISEETYMPNGLAEEMISSETIVTEKTAPSGSMWVNLEFFQDIRGLLPYVNQNSLSVFHADDIDKVNIQEDVYANVSNNGTGVSVDFDVYQSYGTICILCETELITDEENIVPEINLEVQDEKDHDILSSDVSTVINVEGSEKADLIGFQDSDDKKWIVMETLDETELESEIIETEEETFEHFDSAYFSLPGDADTLLMGYFNAGVDADLDYINALNGSVFHEIGEYIPALGSSNYNGNKLINYNGTPFTKALYDGVKQLAESVANGDQTSTIYTMTLTEDELAPYSWTADELGLDSLISDGKVAEGASLAAANMLYDRSLAVHSVIRDCPFEMFWFGNVVYYSTKPVGKVYTADGQQQLKLTGLTLTVKMLVSSDYNANGQKFMTDLAKMSGINMAIVNANNIVCNASGKSDWVKLEYFRDSICGLSDYNQAVYSMPDDYYGNPWQIIFLFDGDPATQVVCEGYSKGFQYLCNKSTFTGAVSVNCIAGLIYSNGWSGGGHMWNIVSFNGENYMVDLTNYTQIWDSDGKFNYDKSLFMAHPISGNVDNGYVFLNGTASYHYDYYYDTRQIYGISELQMNLYHEYTVDSATGFKKCKYCSEEQPEIIIASGICGADGINGDNLTWELSNYKVLTIKGTGTMANASTNSSAFTILQNSDGAFDTANIEKITLESGITNIGDSAFGDFSKLGIITIPETVTSIGSYAFQNCCELSSINIPYGVKNIGAGVITGCEAMNDVYYYGTASEWTEVTGEGKAELDQWAKDDNHTIHFIADGNALFGDCGENLEWSIDGNTLTIFLKENDIEMGIMTDYGWRDNPAPWSWASKRIREIVIADGITHIGNSAFYQFTAVENVTIPETVTSIGSRAFCGCGLLNSITLPSSVESIGEMVFAVCYSLKTVNLPSECSLSFIGRGAFFNCSSLTAFGTGATDNPSLGAAIPYSVTDIENLAFYGCNSLKKAILPKNSMDTIYYGLFAYCTGLEEVVIPNTIQAIGEYVFYHCESLESVTIPAGVEAIYDITFSYCNNLQTVKIPSSVTSIGWDAFFGCNHMTLVNYSGTQAQWNCVDIATGNDRLKKVELNYSVCIDDEKHSISDFTTQIAKEASCEEEGILIFTCCKCGDKYQGTLPPMGHSWDDGIITISPTSTSRGVKTYICTKCGNERQEMIYAIGWNKINDSWYYFTGSEWYNKYIGWLSINGDNYYLEPDAGIMAEGWKQIGEDYYYFKPNGYGQMLTDWQKISGSWYYMDPSSGIMTKGWKKVDGKWYYFNGGGAMVTGWKQIGGKWYYFNGGGDMVTGWKQIGGKWYYFNGDGDMVTGWKQISGKWYYFNGGGDMVSGWKQISGKWYYFNGGGDMVTGWKQIGGKWYYFNGGGDMVTGWKQIGGKWYYFNGGGDMITGKQTIGGKIYTFNNSGVWIG